MKFVNTLVNDVSMRTIYVLTHTSSPPSFPTASPQVWIPAINQKTLLPLFDTAWCLDYTSKLENAEKFKLRIWPEHCLIGTVGHGVVPCIAQALTKWAKVTQSSVEYVRVGANIRTEAYR